MLKNRIEGSFGTAMSDVTRILSAIEQGDPQASEQLLPLVYEELRRLAAQKMAQEAPGQTLAGHGAWSMRRISGSSMGNRRGDGTAVATSFRRLPRPCGGFSWTRPGVSEA